MLEAKTVGYGASGRNGSFAMTVIGLGFGTTAMLRGKRFLRRAHAYMERCVDELERFIDEGRLNCDKVRPGFLRVATTPSYVKRLQKQVELMKSLGFDGISWLDAGATREMVNSERYLGAMWEPRLVLVNPAKLVREQKRVALELGVRVFEDTPVLAVRATPTARRCRARPPPAHTERSVDGAQARVRDQRLLASVRATRPPPGACVHVHDRDRAADRRATRAHRLGWRSGASRTPATSSTTTG